MQLFLYVGKYSRLDKSRRGRARLHEVRKLITERDPETMKVLDAIKFLAERKNLITPQVFPKDPDPPSSRRAGA